MSRKMWAAVGVLSILALVGVCLACLAIAALYPMSPTSYVTWTAEGMARDATREAGWESIFATVTAAAWATEAARPTSTPTPIPLRCGDAFMVTIQGAPTFQDSVGQYEAVGTWLVLQLKLTNISNETYELLSSDAFEMSGTVDGRQLTFACDDGASYQAALLLDVADCYENIPPGLQTTTAVAFDVNPNAGDWRLLFHPGGLLSGPDCSVSIPLQ